jgi:hypothetical protein
MRCLLMPYVITTAQMGGIEIAVVRRLALVSDFSKIVPAVICDVWNFIRAHQFSGAGRNVAN